MIENNKFAIGLSGKQLKVYKDLKEMIGTIDPEVKEDANRNHHRYYASFLYCSPLNNKKVREFSTIPSARIHRVFCS